MFLWVPVLVVLAAVVWFDQNGLKVASTPFRRQKVIFRRRHNWLMTWLCVGTFGSFIGFASAQPMLIETTSTPIDPARSAATYAWIGPAAGAFARWGGGRLADRIGGATGTIVSLVGMAASIVGVINFLPSGGDSGSSWGFVACCASCVAVCWFCYARKGAESQS